MTFIKYCITDFNMQSLVTKNTMFASESVEVVHNWNAKVPSKVQLPKT